MEVRMISEEALKRLHDLGLTSPPDTQRFREHADPGPDCSVWGHPERDSPADGTVHYAPLERIDPLASHPAATLSVANAEIGERPPDWGVIERRIPNVRRYAPEQFESGEPTEITEYLAWYRPFHFEPQDQWGIYFREMGIFKVARALTPLAEPSSGWPTLNELLDRAKELLHHHEAFHHVTEVAATSLEFIDAEAPAGSQGGRYLPYFYTHYEPWITRFDPERPIEEALANAYAYSRPKRGMKKAARRFMRSQPAGYSDFERYLGEHTDFRVGLGRLHGLLRGKGDVSTSPLETLFDLAPLPVVTAGVPTYLVRDIGHPDYALGFRAAFARTRQKRDRQLEKDLKGRKDWVRLVNRFQDKLVVGTTPGVDFEHMCGSWYRAKLDDGLRLILIIESDGLTVHLHRALAHDKYERFRDLHCR